MECLGRNGPTGKKWNDCEETECLGRNGMTGKQMSAEKDLKIVDTAKIITRWR